MPFGWNGRRSAPIPLALLEGEQNSKLCRLCHTQCELPFTMRDILGSVGNAQEMPLGSASAYALLSLPGMAPKTRGKHFHGMLQLL